MTDTDIKPQFRTTDAVTENAQAFAMGSLMISASQSQSRPMESAAMALSNNYVLALATTAQSALRVLAMPSETLQEAMAQLNAAKP